MPRSRHATQPGWKCPSALPALDNVTYGDGGNGQEPPTAPLQRTPDDDEELRHRAEITSEAVGGAGQCAHRHQAQQVRR
ncbi:hypothetical protein, partial [Planosporangium flavigriseum]|uniref:hypothetical protein n=1 Tax=Planosporangium flavigriseum TaxID=373681 RepID=UPI0019524CA8